MTTLRDALLAEQKKIDAALASYMDTIEAPSRLVEAMRYVLLGGGKRIRPILVLATARELGAQDESSMPAALALEMIHAYSLAHDDLPALDNDDERRGRPSAHREYDEATAILAGDALLAEAFSSLLTSSHRIKAEFVVSMSKSLARASGAGGMVGGQVLDIQHLAQTPTELREMHAMKTGALFRCALELGALSAESTASTVARCARYGELFGAAFQLSDDVLDLDEAEQSAHEREVNLAFLDGEDAVRAEIADVCREARELLSDFERPMALHQLLLDWVEERVM